MMNASQPGPMSLVPFVSVDDMMKLVLKVGIDRFLTELAAVIEEDFRRWPVFDKTPRVASHSQEGVIELMPTSDGTLYGFKYVNGHPKNTRDGRQTVTAFGVLSDVGNGYPMLLTEMTILTALRTAATSAVAAKYLARPNSRTMAIIGNGAQSEFQARAFKSLLGIDRLRLFDIDASATRKCAQNLAGLGFTIEECRSVEEAVEGADIITTVTADKQYATILSDNHVIETENLPAELRHSSNQGISGDGEHEPRVGQMAAAAGNLFFVEEVDGARIIRVLIRLAHELTEEHDEIE